MELPDTPQFTVENVEKALRQLYYDPAIENKNVAQKWLMQAQVSPQAWHFCWVLLGPDKIPEIQFFGASALYTKISRYWCDIPEQQYGSLKAQLFAQIAHFTTGPKMVLTRLCVALASLVLNLMPESWPAAVGDMIGTFQSDGGGVEAESNCVALLEILSVLPEEFQSSRLAAERKARVRKALGEEWETVRPVLQQLIRGVAPSPNGVKERVLKCLCSWVMLGIPLSQTEELLQESFAALDDLEVFDCAVEVIVTAFSQPSSHSQVASLLKLLPRVLQLQEKLSEAARTGDMETSHGICRIAVALGENHSRALLEQMENWHGFLALVNMVMFCTGFPGHYPVNETTSSLTLTFWYTLQDDIMSFEAEKQASYMQVYRPVYLQLVDVLLHKAQFPSDLDYSSWSADDKEQFRIYRVDISDTLMYVYEMLGTELLSSLYDKLGRLLTSAEQLETWQRTEVLLYGFQSIAETVDVGYSDVIPGLIGFIPRISINNVHLADTVMLTIGSLAEWLAEHPIMLSGILPLVLQALGNPDLSVCSAATLKKICRECRCDLMPYAADIVGVAQDVLLKQMHKTTQCMWLMQALGYLLSALPSEEILENLKSLITPHVQQLQKLVEETPSPSNKLAILHMLGLFSSLFTTLDVSKQEEESEGETPTVEPALSVSGPNPVVVVLQQVFSLIQTVLSKWLTDSQVVEAVCAVFEKSMKTLLQDFSPMVPQLCEMLGLMYSTVPQASTLNLTCLMVYIFSSEEAHFTPIRALFELVTTVTLSIFQQGPRDHPDIVDSFMELQAEALKRKPDLYLSGSFDVKALFRCGVMSLAFPEAPTIKSTCVFFTELLPHCGDIPCVGQVVQGDGMLLLKEVLQAMGRQLPRCLMESVAEVIFCLNKHCFLLLELWLKEALEATDFPFRHVSSQQKARFREQILSERLNKRQVKEAVREFTLLCRGLHGTEYTTEY